MSKSPEDYVNRHGKTYERSVRIGFLSLPVLTYLTGLVWDEFALAFVHSLAPSYVRVIPWNGEETTDAMLRRVTIYLDPDGKIERVEQEVEVGLPAGVRNGHELSQKLKPRTPAAPPPNRYDPSIIASAMNLLPEVLWDRCTGDDVSGCVYGWIARDDGRSDFVLLRWSEEGFGHTTSSAERSASISKRLFGSSAGHRPCRRVEEVYGEAVANKVTAKFSQE
jgi:hypothetical protein